VLLLSHRVQAKGKAQAQALAQKQASINGQESYQLVSRVLLRVLQAACIWSCCNHSRCCTFA
jgi:hypothetical protein